MKETTTQSGRAPAMAVAFLLWTVAGVHAGDFPRWRGANSGGSAGDPGTPLIESWDDSRVAWVSEVKSPHPYDYSIVRAKAQWPRTNLANGGLCMPAVWDGRVYVSYWRPAGTNLSTHGAEGDKWGKMWSESGSPALQRIEADEVIVCMDAKTGRTLWEAVWPDKEVNRIESYGGHNNICIANGKAYAIGNTGWAYCADAKTGARLWASPVGPSHKVWAEFRKKCIAEGLKSDNPRIEGPVDTPPDPPHPEGGSLNATTYNVCPVVAEGVMITGEWSASSRLVGFDGETGKELWTYPGCGGIATPLLWRHKGREYIVCPTYGATVCLDPGTGKEVWSCEVTSSGTSLGIDGDYLVGAGAAKKDVPPEQQDGWVCYRMTPEKAEKVWALPATAYRSGGYPAPVLHRGHAWFQFSRTAGAKSLVDNCETDTKGGSAVACVELATGKVVSEIGGLYISDVCPGMMAMGDRMFYNHDSGLWMMDIDPKKPRFLGMSGQPCNWCSSCSGADGFIYFRGGERIVNCLDVRKPESRPKPAVRHDDPANALYEFSLPGARQDGKDVRFFMRGRNGTFPQSWAITDAKGYNYPDILDAEKLVLKDGRIAGDVMAHVQQVKYHYKLDMGLAPDGTIKGRYEDTYRGRAMNGTAKGTVRPPALRNGTFDLAWSREWCGGGDVGGDFKMFVDVRDGVFTNVVFKPRGNTYDVTIEKVDCKFDGTNWTDSITLVQRKLSAGRYTIRFRVSALNNRLDGSVVTQKEGGPERTWNAWGGIQVPETEIADPRNGVYDMWLENVVQENGGMLVWFGLKDGKGIPEGTKAYVRSCQGLHFVDPTGLRIESGRLVGKLKAVVNGDGYLLKIKNIRCEYDMDVKIDGGRVEGTAKGMFDARDPRSGEIAGTWRNDVPPVTMVGKGI